MLRIELDTPWGLPLVLAVVLVASSILVSRNRSASDTPQRPPIVSTHPIFGVSEKGNLRDNWAARRRKYGTVFMATESTGVTFVHVGDALALKDIADRPEIFSIGPVHLSSAPMFGVTPPTAQWMAFQGGASALVSLSAQIFSGSKLATLHESFVSSVVSRLSSLAQSGSDQIELFKLVTETTYESTMEALFTPTFPRGTYRAFHEWDLALVEFCNGCPSPASVQARDGMLKLVREQIDTQLSECSVQVREQMETFQGSFGQPYEDAVALVLRNTWLAAVQAPLSAAWLNCLLVHRPEDLKTILTEAREACKSVGVQTIAELVSNLENLRPDLMPTLDALVSETVRVWAAQTVPRVCVQDSVIRSFDKKGRVRHLQFKAGDIVQLAFWNVNSSEINPQWWPTTNSPSIRYPGTLEPFDSTRFNPRGCADASASGNGTPKQNHTIKHGINKETVRTWLPFGIGSRVCPGRFWAVAEIKAFTLLLFDTFDVLPERDANMPAPDPMLWGGALHAEDDMNVHLTLRSLPTQAAASA